MLCVPPQELQERLEKAIFVYVILAGSSLSRLRGCECVCVGCCVRSVGSAAALVPTWRADFQGKSAFLTSKLEKNSGLAGATVTGAGATKPSSA